ncbi:Uncharacterised protein [Nocardia africana]|uniref:Uncharacterized protein n=1 Tax=Nocardia africana TaxID=134964 RepID=A0A378X1H4_9NOCA|nr:Uncharacterised protein [Nocardia africana]
MSCGPNYRALLPNGTASMSPRLTVRFSPFTHADAGSISVAPQ